MLLLGVPAIGKGTQARRLAQDPAYIHIESSVLLQEFALEYPTEVRSEPLHAMFDKTGTLKTSKLFKDMPHFSVIQDRLAAMEHDGRYSPNQFALFDGVIRTAAQAEMFDWILDVTACLYFDESLIPEEELYRHWQSRRRPGETWERFTERQQIAKKEFPGVLNHYAQTGRVIGINPSGTIDDVAKRFAPAAAYARSLVKRS